MGPYFGNAADLSGANDRVSPCVVGEPVQTAPRASKRVWAGLLSVTVDAGYCSIFMEPTNPQPMSASSVSC
jgi:hypothetical protein